MAQSTRPRAAIYTRISGQTDDRRYSLETQAEACIQKAVELGYDAGQADVFEDQWTGAELARPALARLRAKTRNGEYAAIIFYELDRLSRNQAHIYILLDECERRGVKLEGVKDTLDSSPLGKLVMSIKAFIAEIEREKIRDRCQRGKNKKMDEGKILGSGTPRYGYRIDGETGRYIRDEMTGPIVERIFGMVGADKFSLRRTLRVLVEDGIPPPGMRRKNGHGNGLQWGVSTLSKLIRDEVYIGVFVWGKTKTDGTRKNGRLTQKSVDPSEWRHIDGCVTPFISEELWRAANDTIDSRSQDQSRNQKIPRMLRGRIFCKNCGMKMTSISARSPSTGKIHGYYRCSSCESSVMSAEKPVKCGGKNVPCDFIHDAVWSTVVALKNDPDSLKERIERILEGSNDDSLAESLSSLEAEFAKKEKVIGMLRAKWGEAVQSGEPEFGVIVEAQLKASIADSKKLKRACDELAGQIEASATSARAVHDIASKVSMSKAFLDSATFEDKRLLIESLGVRVDANGKDFTVTIDVFADAQPCSYIALRNCKNVRIDISTETAMV